MEVGSNGKRIATWSDDNFIRLWDEKFRRNGLKIASKANGFAFSPDGSRIAVANENIIKVMDATDGHVLSMYRGHIKPVYHLAFRPDGRRIVSASRAVPNPDGTGKLWDDTVKVWDTDNGRTLLTLKGGRSNEVSDVVFSPDGNRIASASWDGSARLWDASNGRKLATFQGHSGFVNAVAFSPDGKRVVTVGDDNTVRVWHATSGLEVIILKGNELAEDDVAFSPDGRMIMTRGYRVNLWDSGVSPGRGE